MPQLIARGSTITLDAETVNNFGTATDAADLTVDIIDASGVNVVTNATPTHVSTGIYQYEYPVPANAMLGAWAAEWSGTIGGQPVVVDDGFTVVLSSVLVVPGGNTTVDDLVTQVEDHLLGGDRDELNFLGATIGSSDSTLTLSSPLNNLAAGSYLGIELEVLYVKSVDPTSQQVTVRRGMLGSTAATHSTDAQVYINPLFSKWQIFKALNVEIVSLSGADNGLFAERAFTLTSQSVKKTYDVPADNADLRQILEIRWNATGAEAYWPRVGKRSYQIIRDVTMDSATATGLALRIEEMLTPGRRIVVRYAGDFGALPAAVGADAAVATAMSENMLDIPALGAAARLMGVREAKRSFVERAVDSRRAGEVPPGSSSRAAAVLLQLLNGRIKSEADRLKHLWPDTSW